ncbi:discoidin domain-containing protein [Streptomyces sp. ME02-8801-2C]|uniref:alpha-L-rhamnosidase-related protein n=1 Tax=Streptomyces sp. ME02-8801-2C TaxID=3028680 RepID=UPI0029BEB0CB|nr:discoidin domain-containing protein [Streptomyces sp. ME02-8801-2C]MDX3452292.1 discoidin domain-containing protein [Streptomyces sp. ME02-8801-2C]
MRQLTRRSVLRTATAVALAPLASSLVLPALAPAAAAADPWTAKWIWAPATATNQWVAFRRSFTLPAKPAQALTRIAADSKYWLWVNGTLVVFEGGLKRGPNRTDTYHDVIDLAPYLTSGSNTVALLVWHFGKQGFSHNSSGKGGLLFQSDVTTGSTTTRIVSDTSWKHTVHPGYSNNTSGAQANFRLPESNIYYDARNATAMAGWRSPGFDDSGWTAPTDFGAAGSAPWNGLVQRPVPLFRHSGLTSYANAASLPSTGQGGTPISATLPSNLQVTPYLRVDAPAGAVIGIQTDHHDDGANLTGIEPGTGFNVRSTYVCAGGVQEFESLGWMSGTAVRYTVPAGVTVLDLKYRESGYDTDFAGSFSSSDPFLDTLWGKAARTMYVNMRDNYMDCPTRERAQWWGDVVNQLKEGFYTFDTRSHALGAKAIAQLTAWQKDTGALYSPVPSVIWTAELPVQMLASVWSFWTYYLYTGNADAVTGAYPAVKKYLNLWALDSDGLVKHRAGDWDWEDWGSDIDARVLDNCWYYLALDTAARLADLSGNSADTAGWRARRDSIRANFDRVLWNSSTNEYRSPGYTRDTDDRANALAVVAGLAPASRNGGLVEVLRTHLNASPYMEFYVLEALYLMGAATVAEERMRNRFAAQVNDPASYTLWELWTKAEGTDNHAWNGGPLYALSAYAAGVRPTQPGWTTYDVVPQTGTLTKINTVTPTVKGDIRFGITREGTQVTLGLTSPSGTTARVGVPTYGGSHPVIKANGTTVFTSGSATGGAGGLTYAGKDSAYVYFTLQPGTWTFTVTGAGRLDNLALGRAVSSNNSLENGDWGRSRLTDGKLTSVTGAKGYTSNEFASADVGANPVWVEIDLGADTHIDAVRLFPRTDTPAVGGGTAGFPVDFTLQTRAAGAGTYTTVRTVTAEPNPGGLVQTYGFRTTTARYVRLQATRLGVPAADESAKYRLQLAELTVPTAATSVTANCTLENGDWGKTRALDGTTSSVTGAKGFTSIDFASADVGATPVWIEVDLGADRAIGSVTLHPRTDTGAAGGGTAGFPVDFTLRTRAEGATAYTTVRTVTGQANPNGAAQTYTLTAATGRYLRLQATRLGAPASDESTIRRLQVAEISIR